MSPVLVADRLSSAMAHGLRLMSVLCGRSRRGRGLLLGEWLPGRRQAAPPYGYLHPSSGTAAYSRFRRGRGRLAARRYVGYVPEDVPLYSHMRVDEFLVFMGRLKGLIGRPLRDGVASVCSGCISPTCGLRPW